MKIDKMTNRAVVFGRIYDFKLTEKVTGATSKIPGTPFISGSIDIATDDACTNIVSVYYTYVAPTYSSGKQNKNYNILKSIIDLGKTVVSCGKDNATLVKASPSIAVNDFYSDNAKTDTNPDGLVSSQRLESGFIEIAKALPEESKRVTIEADLLINNITEVEANPEKNIENDYLKIRGAVFGYGGVLIPVNFNVKSKTGIDFFTSLDLDTPTTVLMYGTISSYTVKYKREIDEDALGFGVPEINETEKPVREWVIVSAYKPYGEDSDHYVSTDELKNMIAARNTHLAEEKKRREDYLASKEANNAPAPGTFNAGAPAAAGGFTF